MQKVRDNFQVASVIVLLETSTNSIILTKRTNQLPHHAGEICFPGGRFQDEDSTLLNTGLRELEEELGIQRERLQNIKSLSPEITLTGFQIYPWFASIATINPYKLQREEVDEIIQIDVNLALKRNNYQSILVPRNGYTIKTLKFSYKEHIIWGATARIMRQLCETD